MRKAHVVAVPTEVFRENLQIGHAVVDGENLLRTKLAGSLVRDRRTGATEHGCELGQNDVYLYLLSNEVVRAGIQGPKLRALALGRGQKQTRNGPQRGVESNVTDDRRTVDSRQDAIHKNGGGHSLGRGAQSFFARSR